MYKIIIDFTREPPTELQVNSARQELSKRIRRHTLHQHLMIGVLDLLVIGTFASNVIWHWTPWLLLGLGGMNLFLVGIVLGKSNLDRRTVVSGLVGALGIGMLQAGGVGVVLGFACAATIYLMAYVKQMHVGLKMARNTLARLGKATTLPVDELERWVSNPTIAKYLAAVAKQHRTYFLEAEIDAMRQLWHESTRQQVEAALEQYYFEA